MNILFICFIKVMISAAFKIETSGDDADDIDEIKLRFTIPSILSFARVNQIINYFNFGNKEKMTFKITNSI
jgi:hypothetical protein